MHAGSDGGAEHGSFIDTGVQLLFPASNAELNAGNSETDTCLAIMQVPNPACLDVKVGISYALTDQPAVYDERTWRFVALQSAGVYQWHEQPVDEPHSYCVS